MVQLIVSLVRIRRAWGWLAKVASDWSQSIVGSHPTLLVVSRRQPLLLSVEGAAEPRHTRVLIGRLVRLVPLGERLDVVAALHGVWLDIWQRRRPHISAHASRSHGHLLLLPLVIRCLATHRGRHHGRVCIAAEAMRLDRGPQTALVEVEELSIRLILYAFKASTSPRRLSSVLSNEASWGLVIADALDNLHLLLPVMLPIVDIVARVLLLQTLQ